MEQNSLINLLKNSMTFVSSSVSAVVGALVTTLFLRKNTETNEFEKIKAGKFEEVANELLDSGKMTYLEYYKCKNFLKIAKLADKKLQEESSFEENTSEKAYDFDWFVRFYDYSSNVSDEQMQKLWSSILAGEVKNPGTTSISLMHALSMMRQDQAMFFCNISRFVLKDIKTYEPHLLLFVSSNREAYKSSGITPAALKELEHLGLVECDFATEYIFIKKKMFRSGNKIITVYGDPNNDNKIKAGNVNFTKDGKLLYAIIDDSFKRYRNDILNFTIKKFTYRNCQVKVNDTELLSKI